MVGFSTTEAQREEEVTEMKEVGASCRKCGVISERGSVGKKANGRDARATGKLVFELSNNTMRVVDWESVGILIWQPQLAGF
jgi:hypothetical protein